MRKINGWWFLFGPLCVQAGMLIWKSYDGLTFTPALVFVELALLSLALFLFSKKA